MSVIKGLEVDKIYKQFKNKNAQKYKEEEHCKLLIRVMMDKDYGCHSAFCVQAMISEWTFYLWVRNHELFGNLYYFTRMVAKQLWYEEGRAIRDKEYQIGTMNYEFEHWKLMGWAKFGISKNSKIRINVNPDASPAKHYSDILRQASEGDFTASEFKQLMEAVNVGLNVHQTFELQKQIDELKSNQEIMMANTNADNPFANKGTAKAD
jgi:hypothetical protein